MNTAVRFILATALVAALLSGCGIFGCAGAGGNGGFAAGCAAGTRF
jgi:hypothetical protein